MKTQLILKNKKKIIFNSKRNLTKITTSLIFHKLLEPLPLLNNDTN